MRLFRRRPAGRHAGPARGAATVAIPAQALPPWEQAGWTPPSYAQPWLAPEPEAVPEEPQPALRVELGFRDGSTAALAPDSAQARALGAVAEVLVRRD